MLLATSEDHKSLPNLRSIVPWTSKSKTKSEALPLETYFLYRREPKWSSRTTHERFANLFLKRRTEPLAMRGEKIFVYSCLACHGNAQGTTKAQTWTGTASCRYRAFRSLNERDQRALRSYLDLFKSENTVSATASQ